MALSGSITGNILSGHYAIRVDWTATQNYINNTSTVNCILYFINNWDISIGARNHSITIDSTTSSLSSGAISTQGTHYIGECTKVINHNSDGDKSINISAIFDLRATINGTYYSNITASATVALNNIDRSAPNVSFSSSNITANSITLNASASTSCDVWRYSLDDGNTWTTFSSKNGTSASVTITGLTPNTTYNVCVSARKNSNAVYGYSSINGIKTLGGSLLNSINDITADNTTVTLKFNITVYNSAYTHTLNIKKDNQTILSFTDLTLNSGNNSITLTATQKNTLLNAMASVKNFTATVELITYNGSQQIGNTSVKNPIIKTTVDNSSPIFTAFSYADINTNSVTVTGNNQILIQGISTLKIIASAATARNGATISSYSFVAGEKAATATTNEISLGNINTSGIIPIVVTAIDSRGYTTSVTVNVTVVEYKAIKIDSATMRRVNDVENITQISLSGTICPIKINNVNNNTLKTLSYRYKITSEDKYSEWFNINAIFDDDSFSFSNNEFISLNSDYSYHIEFAVYDKLTVDSYIITLPQGVPLISFRKQKVGINTNQPSEALDVVGNGKISGNLTVAGSKIIKPGTPELWYGAPNKVPPGYLLCDGAAYPKDVYPNLFNFAVENWGVSASATAFNVPNFKGRTFVMVDGSAEFQTLGSVFGDKELQAHNHLFYSTANTSIIVNKGTTISVSNWAERNINSLTTGSGSGKNIQPSICGYYIIKY